MTTTVDIRTCCCGEKIAPGVIPGVWLDEGGWDCCEDTGDSHEPFYGA